MSKTVSAGFKTMLNTSQVLLGCDLYTVTLSAGGVYRTTNAPIDIVVAGNTYLHEVAGVIPGMERGPIKLAIGLQVESIDVTVKFDASTLWPTTSTPGAFANAGGFDNARIQIDKLLTPDFADTSRGVVNLFTGVVSEIATTDSRATLHCSSDLVYLDGQFPRNYFLPSCNNALFDSNCGLNKATYAVNGTATAGNTVKVLTASALTQATDYFALGYVIFNTGANAGLVRSVKSSVSGALTLLYPLPVACANGDTFTAYPGCDKLEATCLAKFNNLGHHRGFPFVPTQEQIELGSAGSAPSDSSLGSGLGGTGRGTGGQQGSFKQK
jgi:uncharacterized phage protein (TIGR02218 family)